MESETITNNKYGEPNTVENIKKLKTHETKENLNSMCIFLLYIHVMISEECFPFVWG